MDGLQILGRAIAVAATCAILAPLAYAAQKRLRRPNRLIFWFVLLVYGVTFLIGATLIFVFQGALLESYFIGSSYLPANAPYWIMWGVILQPILAVILLGYLPNVRLGPEIPSRSVRVARSSFVLTAITTLLVLGLAVLLLRGAALRLIASGLQMQGASDLGNFYWLRQAVFQNLGLAQFGTFYGMLPALSAGLLLYVGQNQCLVRGTGLVLVGIIGLLNIATFQMAPVLAFALILGCLWFQMPGNKAFSLKNIAIGVLLLLVFNLYQSMKGDGTAFSGLASIAGIFLRMPVATPYLFEMHQSASGGALGSASLPQALGYYMYPDQAGLGDFLAMPQPGYLGIWYSYGPVASLLSLIALFMTVFLATNLITRSRDGALGFAQIVALYSVGHLVYYAFQTTYAELLFSSYSVVFAILPALVYGLSGAVLKIFAQRRPVPAGTVQNREASVQ